MKRIGLIVNPIAGLGGPVGLKGTDGAAERALALGAVPRASGRARRALAAVRRSALPMTVLTSAGAMGEEAAEGLPLEIVHRAAGMTTGKDTRDAALAIEAAGAGLILFSGGDGTARDILDAIGGRVPVLGIPSGVKMHSAVFATSPEAAGQLLVLHLAAEAARIGFREREVMDVDEEGLREGRLSARLYGYARVPEERRFMQAAKAGGGGRSEDAALDGAAHAIAKEMAPGVLHLIGPGTSAKRVLAALGLEGALLGIDAVLDGRLAGRDVSETEILRLAEGRPLRIVVGVTGGQGFVLGRGNQQLSPEVIRRAEITIIASVQKLVALGGEPLRVDTGDPGVDRALAGYVRVVTGPGETMIMRIG